MKTRLLRLVLLLLCGVLFQFCNEPSDVVVQQQAGQPPVTINLPTGIQLAVGNAYHWRYTQISNHGSITQRDETYNIVRETTVNAARYYVLSTGEVLRDVEDTVFAYVDGSVSVYYRLDASVGQTVPFMGYQLPVTFVDTSAVFGETQRIITVSNQSDSPSATLDLARYSTTFGLIAIDRSDGASATTGVLVGAQLGTVRYGDIP